MLHLKNRPDDFHNTEEFTEDKLDELVYDHSSSAMTSFYIASFVE